MMTNLTKNEICSLFEGTKAWFDKSLQWTVTADVRLLLECFRLELKADFDKLLLQLGAGSLFKQRPGEFIGIAPNLWRIWGGWIYGGFVEEFIENVEIMRWGRIWHWLPRASHVRELSSRRLCRLCRLMEDLQIFHEKTSPINHFFYSSEQQIITVLLVFQNYNQKASFHIIYVFFS